MLVKICGLKSIPNTKKITGQMPDLIGIIMYQKSLRFPANYSIRIARLVHQANIKLVIVTVNKNLAQLQKMILNLKPHFVQLHGNESYEYCQEIKKKNIKIIKAIPIEKPEDIENAYKYTEIADIILFDKKCDTHGGSGQKFDWSMLDSYNSKTPFMLSGGISPDDVKTIKMITHKSFIGIDINSKFETKPGIKNVTLVEKFIKELRHDN